MGSFRRMARFFRLPAAHSSKSAIARRATAGGESLQLLQTQYTGRNTGDFMNRFEKLLTTGADPVKGVPRANTNPPTLEKLVDYLRALMRSVERHTKLGGRCGYLEFVREFIP